MCGVATFLQLQLRKHFGIGLPVVLGCAFQSVAPLSIIGAKQGSGYMFGALIVSGIYVILISGIFSKIADFFPPGCDRFSYHNNWFNTFDSCCNWKYGKQC